MMVGNRLVKESLAAAENAARVAGSPNHCSCCCRALVPALNMVPPFVPILARLRWAGKSYHVASAVHLLLACECLMRHNLRIAHGHVKTAQQGFQDPQASLAVDDLDGGFHACREQHCIATMVVHYERDLNCQIN